MEHFVSVICGKKKKKKLLAALQVLLVESHGNLQKSVLHRAHPVRIQIEESSISPFSRKSWEETKEMEGQRERDEACSKPVGRPKRHLSSRLDKLKQTCHMLLVSCQFLGKGGRECVICEPPSNKAKEHDERVRTVAGCWDNIINLCTFCSHTELHFLKVFFEER